MKAFIQEAPRAERWRQYYVQGHYGSTGFEPLFDSAIPSPTVFFQGTESELRKIMSDDGEVRRWELGDSGEGIIVCLGIPEVDSYSDPHLSGHTTEPSVPLLSWLRSLLRRHTL
jgi:hypothetical protein